MNNSWKINLIGCAQAACAIVAGGVVAWMYFEMPSLSAAAMLAACIIGYATSAWQRDVWIGNDAAQEENARLAPFLRRQGEAPEPRRIERTALPEHVAAAVDQLSRHVERAGIACADAIAASRDLVAEVNGLDAYMMSLEDHRDALTAEQEVLQQMRELARKPAPRSGERRVLAAISRPVDLDDGAPAPNFLTRGAVGTEPTSGGGMNAALFDPANPNR